MKIHYFAGEEWEREYVKAALPSDEVVFHSESLAALPELADPEAEVLSVFVESEKIGEAVLARFPKLKLIATRSTGFDHIDLAAAAARGVAVANVPSYGENTVAEFAFALILALSRRVIEADTQVRTTGTFTFSPTELRGFDLSGKTLGVVGCGHIGMHAVRMGNGFEMKVLGFDAFKNDELPAKFGFTYVSLEELLAQADVITLHVPYNVHTHHLINQDNIGKIKKGAILVNTSRGAVVETDALIQALKNGTLAGAALDVLEEEGELKDEAELALLTAPHPNEDGLKTALENHYLIDHPRVIVTPHVAFNTDEAVRRIVDTTLESVKGFEAGAPINLVKTA